MDVQCCKCMKTRDEHGWRWSDEFTNRPVSYSYCPECLEEFRSESGFTPRRRTHTTTPALITAFA